MKKNHISFVLGGATCGKSIFAVQLAKKLKKDVVYVATSLPTDSEMQRKINDHQKQRPSDWVTLEAAKAPFDILGSEKIIPCMLIDGTTFWVSSLMLEGKSFFDIREKAKIFLEAAKAKVENLIIVSDEVGGGIVPVNDLARHFREIQGKVNQDIAACADQVYWIAAGIPVQIK